MAQAKHQNKISHLMGYLLIPHELLHIVGFRLVGKRCEYQWGNSYVTPIGPMTRWERLVGRLFPSVVFLLLLISFGILAGFASEQVVHKESFFWFIFWVGLAYIASFYTCSAIGDLRQAYLLIFNKPWHSWTPFDFFFWPFVDWAEIRKKAVLEEVDDE